MDASVLGTQEDRIFQLELLLKQYKDRFEKLRKDNEDLNENLVQGERDTIDVIAFFRRESDKKDEIIQKLQDEINTLNEQRRQQIVQLENGHQKQLRDLEENLEQKDSQLRVAQAELASLKEFKTKRHEVQEELVRARKDLEEFERKHQETISKMEHKFYEEKVRLQKETNQKMAEIQKLSHEVIASQLKFT
eukprot:TRINITY_DN2358_c0_g1_i5.p1 TRINITY_DN2358_c0_g1~~TRINITY_DN2358_c0_g1_i5.p1  ORF type:complete len:192 (-),score=59.04 TRINITY_DN2358_c0_g1_i5:115-690(-)